MRENHRVALYGMGGVGKTQIALEYVYSNRKYYDRIYWIRAVDEVSMFADFEKISKTARLYTSSDLRPAETAERVKTWLEQEISWLVVFDNLDNIETVNGFLPENGPKKHTLITTRNPNSSLIPAIGIEVPFLERGEAIELLRILSEVSVPLDSEEMEEAYKIVDELGCLPLAIEQAAAYVREITATFVGFLENYALNRKELLEREPLMQGNRPYKTMSVTATLLMSFKVIQGTSPRVAQAAQLFRLLAFLNPDGILIKFLQSGSDGLENGLKALLLNKNESLAKALVELEKLSLIKWDRKNKMLLVHRLVQTVVKEEMLKSELTSNLSAIIDLCDQAFPQQLTSHTRDLCREYQGQVVEPLSRITDFKTEKTANIKRRVAKFLLDEGKYKDSERLLLQAVQIGHDLWDNEHPVTLGCMDNLALAYIKLGKTQQAIDRCKELLEIYTRTFGAGHIQLADILNKLGNAYFDQGDYLAAMLHFKQALELTNQEFGDGHFKSAHIINNIGNVYKVQKDYASAKECYEKALSLIEREFGNDHIELVYTLNNIGTVCNATGKCKEAFSYYRRALEIVDREYGVDHVRSAEILQNLGNVSYWLEQYEDAKSYSKRSVNIFNRVFGDGHIKSAEPLKNLANVDFWQERYDEAFSSYQLALKILDREWGINDFRTVGTINSLAAVCILQNRYNEAILYYQRALAILNLKWSVDHIKTVETISKLGDLCYSQQLYDEAMSYYQRALRILNRERGEDDIKTADTICNIGKVFYSQQSCKDALSCIERADNIYQRFGKERSFEFISTLTDIARSYLIQGDEEKAITIYERAVKVSNPNATTIQELEHEVVVCDGCSADPLKGYRYKCCNCEDYDLCGICFEQRLDIHPIHTFLQIPSSKFNLELK